MKDQSILLMTLILRPDKAVEPVHQCCQLGGFPTQLGCFFSCVAGNVLLLRVAFFGQGLSKYMRFFGLFLLNIVFISAYFNGTVSCNNIY